MNANTRPRLYNERIERLLANCDLILREIDVKKGKILFNYSFSSQDGIENDQSEYTVSEWTALLHPGDRQDTLDSINRLIEAEADSLLWEFRIKTDQNNWKSIYHGKTINNDKLSLPGQWSSLINS